MRFKIFTFNVTCTDSIEEVNKFLASRKVINVDRKLVTLHDEAYWTFTVQYDESQSPKAEGQPASSSKVDYKEVLSPEEFTVFAKLRDVRKSLAETQGVPVYAVFTNEQLAEIVRQRIVTKEKLSLLPGVGDQKMSKFADAILVITKEEFLSEENQPPV